MGTSVGVVGVGTGGHQLGGTEGCAPPTNFGIQQGGADSMCPPSQTCYVYTFHCSAEFVQTHMYNVHSLWCSDIHE